MPLMDNPRVRTAHEALHHLWSKAVGTPGYNKAEWKQLEAAVEALGAVTLSPSPPVRRASERGEQALEKGTTP